MIPKLTKQDLKTRLGIELDSELATFYGISQSAVNQWGDGNVPEPRVSAAMVMRPECFRDHLVAAETAAT